MTKTTKAKLAPKPDQTDTRTFEEVFDQDYRRAELFKADATIAQDTRADTWIGIRASYKDMFGEWPDVGAIERIVNKVLDTHKEIRRRIEDFDAKDFGVAPDKFKDPYADLLVHKEHYDSWDEAFEDYMLFNAVRPFGENAQRINDGMLSERFRVKDEAEV